MKAIAAFLLLLSTTAIAVAAPAAEGNWSDAVHGVRGRLVLGKDPDFNGAEMLVVYLELQNVRATANPRKIWSEPLGAQFKWELKDSAGVSIPDSPMVAS